jgi:hypothetical protein
VGAPVKSATDRELDAVDATIEELRRTASLQGSFYNRDANDRLQQLYLRRDALQKRQFKALQRKIKRMPK